jgi:1-phosphatidylinositol-3-phosphate 5-kinase
VKQIFSSLLSGSGSTTVQIPFPADEHHLLAQYQKVAVVVRDQEPSSIIAYTLSSDEYEQCLQTLRTQAFVTEESSVGQRRSARSVDPGQPSSLDIDVTDAAGKKGVLSFLKGSSRDKSPHKSGIKCEVDTVKYTPRCADKDTFEDSDDVVDAGPSLSDSQKLTKSTRQQPINYHIELQFNDSSTKFYCRVYFADQFYKLRKLIFPDGEERYIRSLSRCVTWLARGGKSGSVFCKTRDDRFILKQMSRYEVQSFNEFAPHYFQYITSAHSDRKPTVLAKIVGVYKIGYQNTKTGTALKQDLLVMENLFYDRKMTQIYDLKGSARNRLVSTSGKRAEDLVLLDENLLKVSIDNPLYVYPHSKTVLTSAITQDTHFLASHSVMDYSLLVGLDDAANELVIGIIDYIRTFTWDKMLEMVLKKQLSGTMPTVLSPELYRRRFLEAMDKYFLFVPDRWTGHGRGMES